jgi:hypothetical protein
MYKQIKHYVEMQTIKAKQIWVEWVEERQCEGPEKGCVYWLKYARLGTKP